jgi:hypothetical protein
MNRVFLYIFVVLLLAVTAFGQSKEKVAFDTRIAGTWILDLNKSNLGYEDPFYRNRYLQISAADSEIVISLLRVSDDFLIDKITFYTDNRGEINNAGSTRELSSKTKIKKEKIVRRYSVPIRTTSGWTDSFIAVTETYFLSTDRDTLTINKESQTQSTPRIGASEPSSDTRTVRRVYNRRP